VYDYVPGKVAWLAPDVPPGRTDDDRTRAGDVARPDVPTCLLDEPMDEVRERVRAAGWDACVVVNEERVVFGLLREKELAKGAGEPVERVMRPGPSTFRPNVPIEEMAGYMVQHALVSSPITSADGRLIGLLRRDDAVRVTLEILGHRHDEQQ
jgi:CBS domain-containing protein